MDPTRSPAAGRVIRHHVALTGRSGTGKTTIANYLMEHHGYVRCSTGRACRLVCQMLFASESKTLLNLVTDKMKEIDPEVWLKAALKDTPVGVPLVFDSMRFEVDWLYFAERAFKLVRVVAPHEIRIERLKTRGQEYDAAVDDRHAAEVELEHRQCHAVIMNDLSDVQPLHERIETALASL